MLSFQNAATKKFLIVGLGNPGVVYEKTRHNVGFLAVRAFARRHSISFKAEQKMPARVGKGMIGNSSAYLLLPLSYMNQSGESVSYALKMFTIQPAQVAIVVDDIALPIGVVRFKEGGSSGGHNGLRSVEHHLGTSHYPRIRIGIGAPKVGNLADFVLANFSHEEEQKLSGVLDRVSDVLDCWILKGMQPAMSLANTNKS